MTKNKKIYYKINNKYLHSFFIADSFFINFCILQILLNVLLFKFKEVFLFSSLFILFIYLNEKNNNIILNIKKNFSNYR